MIPRKHFEHISKSHSKIKKKEKLKKENSPDQKHPGLDGRRRPSADDPLVHAGNERIPKEDILHKNVHVNILDSWTERMS